MRETEQLGPEGVTTQQLVGRWARVDSGSGRRSLLLLGRPIATLDPSPAAVTAVCATAGPSSPLVDLLSAFAGHRPTGVLVLEDARGGQARAFALRDGAVVAAVDRVVEIAGSRAELEECFCEAIAAAGEIGTRMTLVRGDVVWLGQEARDHAPALQHLLFEAVRRIDEMPRLIASLGGLDRVAMPVVVPGPRPVADDADDDAALEATWLAARRLWRRIDGRRSVQELTGGRFGPLQALSLLVRAGCVRLEAASAVASTDARSTSTEYAYGSADRSSRTEHVRIDRVRTIVAPGARRKT